METPIAVGSIYIGVSAIGIILNTITVRAIVVQGKLKKTNGAMYILYLQPLITDILFELIHMCYIAPSIIIQGNIFGDSLGGGRIAKMFDTAQTYCWYNNSLSQVSLAMNRFVVTVLLRLYFFTPLRTALITASQHILALSIAVTIQYILPCCGIQLVYASFSYNELRLPSVPNYAWAYIKLPFKIGCSVVPFIIYGIILLSWRLIGKKLQLQSNELNKRRKQELRFTIQFASIAALYTISWGTFSILPAMNLSVNNVWIQGFAVVFNLLNSMTNAVLFLLNDKKKLFHLCMPSTYTTGSSYGS